MNRMETEEPLKAPRGLLLSLGVIMLLLGAGLAAEFVLQAQPCLNCGGTVVGGEVDMPAGVGSSTQLNFSPGTITVIIGFNNTVTFTNKDSANHTVTATDHSFDSGIIEPGQSWTHTFSTAGTYTYYCIFHTWMKGKVIVLTATSGGTGLTVKIPSGTGNDPSLNYAPSSFTVVIGVNNTVTFVNQDNTNHTVTANDGSFDSGNIVPGGSWSHAFTTPGTYSFHCIYHTWMKGTIEVKAGSA
jgi:plastocyanin